MIFGIRLKRKQKHIRESELQAWNNMAVWKDFTLAPDFDRHVKHVNVTC
jgi:hypothetical protein